MLYSYKDTFFIKAIMELEELKTLIQNIADKTETSYSKPSPAQLPKDLVYMFGNSIAKKYREENGITETNINLREFVKSAHGKIHCVDIDDYAKSGSIYIHNKESFDIVLPMFTAPIRDRFTIAHEMGHFFLHSLAGERKMWADRKGSGPVEWEANWFAASFLMPRYLIKKNKITTVSEMMDAFGVSAQAAELRLEYNG